MRSMRNLLLLALLATASACGDDGGSSIDAAPGPACTGALYDRCTTDADCDSGMCRQFNNLNALMCTQACTMDRMCPAGPGGAATCPNSGQCRPVAASTCTPQ